MNDNINHNDCIDNDDGDIESWRCVYKATMDVCIPKKTSGRNRQNLSQLSQVIQEGDYIQY